ncbi:beta-1,3-galactosyltransferase 1-like isoform X1 [Clarias gariepinus]|uniref:beta-1,3-galactosyltransferase 1-like isoform X1 n=2 Tax=Clarias gariepinus TaxID=13013 RepID=UPI00234D281C|nr:beta-1,3-galactosyltransferase 1-like isoform X1 [Clarias gariepinus]
MPIFSTSNMKKFGRPAVLERLFGCQSSYLRAAFLILVFSAALLFYYVNLPEKAKIRSEKIHIINNMDYTTAKADIQSSNPTIHAAPVHWSPSLNTESGISVLSSVLQGEKCPPESTYVMAYPCKYHYILNESERCQNEKPFLVLMVPVAPKNREARDAIRTTWGSEKMVMGKVVSLFFLLGQPGHEGREKVQQMILQESEKYHDIIQSDFLDSYKNLTIKTMVNMEWLATYCQNATYAMKIDSDIFLNVNSLINMLLQAPRENYMTGNIDNKAFVIRDPNSKWYLPKDVFPDDFYPPYALGLGYVLSLDLPNKLIEGAKHTQPVYIEDVFLGLCMRYLGIPFTIQADQSLFNRFPIPYNRCRYSKLIATTTHSLQDQVNFWKDLKKPGPTC